VRPLWAQAKAETWMTLRRGETLLVTIGIPVVFVVFFSQVHVLPTGEVPAVTFVVPGILALAVMSTAMVALGSATGFERGYGVLKRLGTTPLRRDRLVAAKIATVVLVELVQAAVLIPIGLGLGWRLAGPGTSVPAAVGLVLLATVAFGGIGLFFAGLLRAEVNLAVINGLYLVLLLLGGMLVPLAKLPPGLATFARGLPAAALSSGLHASLGGAGNVPVASWVVLAIWAIAAPAVTSLTFRWE
jgi:ABC-2 type transport system permease protein